MSLLIWGWLSFENNLKTRAYLIKISAWEIGVGIHIVLGCLRVEFTECDILDSLMKRKLKGDLTAVYSYQMGGCETDQNQTYLSGAQWKKRGSGDRLEKGSCNLVKGKKTPTNYRKGFQTQEGAQTGISILGDAPKSARQGPQHPVLRRLALNLRFDYVASLWRSLQAYVILCCCDLILDLHILNRILKKPIKSYNTCCTSWCIFLISTLKNTSTSCLYNPVS